MKAEELILKLLDELDRRKEDYLHAISLNEGDTRVSFTARAGEVEVFKTDLEMLLERLGEEK